MNTTTTAASKSTKQDDVIKGGLVSMDKLIKEKDAPLKIYKEGDAVEAKIRRVSKNKLYVDIDERINGIVGGKELLFDPQFVKGLNEGDSVTAYVVFTEDDQGNMLLSLRKAGKENIWASLRKKQDDKENMSVVATEANKGGLIIELGGVKGFLPVSQLSAEHYPRVEGGDKDAILGRLSEIVGTTLEVKVMSLDKSSNKLIFSERAAIGNRDVPEGIKVGDVVEGSVAGIVDFGFFVDVGGVEGLVHISEISWGKVDNIDEFVKVGDKLKLKIIDIENSRLSLSLKRLEGDPWKKLIEGLKKGDKIKGKISKITPFGAFVRIKVGKEGGVDALVHISEISEEHLSDPNEVLNVGEEKEFQILSIEPDQHRLSLSLKALNKKQETPQKDKKKTAEDADKSEDTKEKEEKKGGLKSLGANIAKKLASVGIKKEDDLRGKKKEDLVGIEGIGEKTAEKILELKE